MLLVHLFACGIGSNPPGDTVELGYELAIDAETDDLWLLHLPPDPEGEEGALKPEGHLVHVDGASHAASEVDELSITTWPTLGFGSEGPLLAWTEIRSSTKARVRLYDRELLEAKAERGLVLGAFQLSPAGDWLVSGAESESILLDSSLTERRSLDADQRLLWLADERLVSISEGLLVQTWDPATLQELGSLQLDTTDLKAQPFGSVEVHPHSAQLMLSLWRTDETRGLRAVDLDALVETPIPELHSGSYSGDGSLFVQSTGTDLLLLDTETLQVSSQAISSLDSEWGVWVSEDGAWVLLQGDEDELSVVNVADGSHTAHSWSVGHFVVRGDEVWSTHEGQLAVLSLATGELTSLELGTPVDALAHAPNRDRIVVRSEDQHELLWVHPETGAVEDAVGL